MQRLVTALARGDLVDREERDRAVRALLDHLSSPAEPWTGPVGVVRVDVDLPDGACDSWTVGFAATGVGLVDTDPQVVVRLPLAAATELASGAADGALLYLSGVLEVVGDELVLLGVGTQLLTAAERPLIDAAALDPQAVSEAIAGSRTEHLAAVMAGGFRELVLSEVFRRLPEFVIPEKAARARVGVGFEIGGRHDGEVDRYVVRIADGACSVIANARDDEPVDATVVLEGHEFLRLVLGHLNPVRGVVSGQLRVRGQLIKALGFSSVMRRPGYPQAGAEVLDR